MNHAPCAVTPLDPELIRICNAIWQWAARRGASQCPVLGLLQGSSGRRMTCRWKAHGELLQHISRGAVLVVAAGLTLR